MRFKLSMAALAACAATALTAGAASANVTYYPYGVGAPTLTLVTDFSADTLNTTPTHTPLGWSWSGNSDVRTNTGGANYAAPAIGPAPGTKLPKGVDFLAVGKGQSETLSIPNWVSVKDIAFYNGSLDALNKVTFSFYGNVADQSFTGKQLAALGIGAVANGNQYSAASNGIFDFVFSNRVKSVDFSSSVNSFEIWKIYAAISSVPEPSEWLMLTLGVAMIGAVARRKRSFAGAAVVA